jgi:2-C-methyl-D-erythritol 4-phosphate cytidylyltransferase/2-C-methyl-D-erythritol 2,4-cyclodiphosphate synthase
MRAVILLGAGLGSRLGGEVPKAYRKIKGTTLFDINLQAFEGFLKIAVINKEHIDIWENFVQNKEDVLLVNGGQTRSESVHNGLLEAARLGIVKILIHDVARARVSKNLINNVYQVIEAGFGVIPAIKSTDSMTFKNKYIDRSEVKKIQTPQGFMLNEILTAYQTQQINNFTDDGSIFLANGGRLKFIEGESGNIKITHKNDLLGLNIGEYRVGSGFDVHAFDKNKNTDGIMVCGVKIPYKHPVLAHSDGDVGLHALTDAILGACGLGSIGVHFPPSDEKWRGASSEIFVKHALSKMQEVVGKLVNIDITIITQEPKIMPYSEQIRTKISQLTGLEISRINLKATTTEFLGFIGRGEGICATVSLSLVF